MHNLGNWTKVFSTAKPHLAEMAKQMLENKGFAVQILDQQDSSYHFGSIHLFVKNECTNECLQLIKQFNTDLNLE